LTLKPLLAQAGLTLQQIKDRKARVGVRNQIEYLNLVSSGLRDDFLGMHLAQDLDLRELGLLYYVQASSETLGDALRKVARYSTIHNEGVCIACNDKGGLSVTFNYVDVTRIDDHHQIEFFVVTLLRVARQLTGRQLVPSRIQFIHRRAETPAEFKSFFGCDLAFGNKIDEVSFPRGSGRLPVVGADPYLNSLLVRYCEEAILSRRPSSNAWRSRVENAIAPLLPHGEASMSEIALRLGIGRRTLARRLQDEGCTFAEVLDDLRCDLAKRYLSDQLPITKITWLLGYSEPSAFSHAFKRWTGMTPARSGGQRVQSRSAGATAPLPAGQSVRRGRQHA